MGRHPQGLVVHGALLDFSPMRGGFFLAVALAANGRPISGRETLPEAGLNAEKALEPSQAG